MASSTNRVLVNTVVKQAIHALKQDPERTTRNLVDMALKFADSRFQREFYSSAQALLSDESSAYYALAKDTLTKVNEETLLTFSMNLGYNGLYEGAEKIRNTEENSGFNIPWTISLTIVEGKLYDQHHRLIMQGEQMGIHCWHLFSDHGIYECMTLAESHPESAFILFCGSGELNMNVIDYASGLHNIAFAVPFDKEADTACQLLSISGILYAVYDTYSADDLADIENGTRFEELQQLNPVFTILKPNFLCQNALQARVYAAVTKARMDQKYHAIPWELYQDTKLIDGIISEEPCWVGFDEYGQLTTEQGVERTYGLSIFVNDLPEILKRAFPKKGMNQA